MRSMKGMAWSRTKWISMFSILLLYALTVPDTGGCPLLWSYSINGISALSVSENGNFMAVGCQDGWYYIFDTWGNLAGSGNVTDAVVSLDIANTGDLIIGFGGEYMFCPSDGTDPSGFQSSPVRNVSISSDGLFSLACCQKNIFINYESSMLQQLSVSSDFPFGAVSSDGSLICAAAGEFMYIFDQDLNSWSYEDEEEIENLFISENGRKITFSTKKRVGFIDMEAEEAQSIDVYSVQNMAAAPSGDMTVFYTGSELIWLKGGILVNELDVYGDIQFVSLADDGLTVIGEDTTIQIMKADGISIFTYDFESSIKALEICEERDLLIVCTENSIYAFQLFQKTYANTHFISTASRRSLPLTSELEEVWSLPVAENAYFLTGDVDGDGFIEILLIEGTTLKLLDGNGNVESVRNLEISPNVYFLLDIDRDTIPEIPLTFISTEFGFSVYDWKENTTRDYNLGSLGGVTPLHNAEVMPLAVLDIDGGPQIIGEAVVGYSCKPRGIVSVDSASGDVTWFYQTKGSPMSRAIADIDGDGTKDIIVGRMAPCTCPDDEEYPDCEIYVTALSGNGEELWEVYLGYGFGRVEICAEDIDECEGTEIIGFGYEASELWGTLFVLNCRGDTLYSHEVDYSIVPGGVADIDADGHKEIVAVDTRGVLTVYTSDLKEKSSIFVKGGINPRADIYLNDINGDRFPEILLGFDKELWIFDRDLNILWHKEFESAIRFGITNLFQCKNTLLVVSDKLHAYSYETGDSPCPLWKITERDLLEEGNHNLEKAESLSAAGQYRISRPYYEHALDCFQKLENNEKIDFITEEISRVSEAIFKGDIKTGIILLGICDTGLCIFLLYYWRFTRNWSRLAEGTLLLSLPLLLSSFQVYYAEGGYLHAFVTYFAPSLVVSIVIVLRQNILGFLRSIGAILSGHKDMLVLSIIRQSDEVYRISVESIEERFEPVKESRKVIFPSRKRENLIKKTELMIKVLNQFSSANAQKKSFDYAESVLRETGTVIYENFIPPDFTDILKAKFLLLEVEDIEIPWELMYSDGFFASKYAVSRRIVSPDPVNVRYGKNRGRRALIISDPSENLPGAKTECEIVLKRLKQKMDVVFVKGYDANIRRIANQLGQGFDIIHYAGHIDNGLLLSDGIISSQDVREFIVGTPIVFVNGCKSEDLVKAFLLGGAMAYLGTSHPVHDKPAADFAADFYDLCLQYQIGEALRKAREYHMDRDLVWASLVMYGDPTLKLF
jgi:hypothetical protein